MAQAPLQQQHSGMANAPPRLDLVFQRYDPPLYFVTFNTDHRRKLLASDKVHSEFVAFAEAGAEHRIAVGRYVIMPDHVHLFVRGSDDYPLTQWVRLLKRRMSEAIAAPLPHWQKGFFDHLIRNSESYVEKWSYVRANPVRAGLTTCAEVWPYQGELVYIDRP